MRKFIIFILFFLGTLLAFSGDAKAIQYSQNFAFPNIVVSGSTFGTPTSYVDGFTPYIYNDSTDIATALGSAFCVHLSSGTVVGDYWDTGRSYNYPYNNASLTLYFSGIIGSGTFYMRTFNENNEPIKLSSWNYNLENNGGNHPDEAIVCYFVSWAKYNSSGNVYLYSISAVGIRDTVRYALNVYTGSSENGLLANGYYWASVGYHNGATRWNIPSFDYTYTGSLYNLDIVGDFFTGITQTTSHGVEYPLPYYFGVTTTEIYNGGGSNSGSGSSSYNSYIANCTGFLDIGCYIKGSFNWFIDTIKYYLFPSINFTGNSSNCLTGSISGVSGGVSSIGYFQKIANFVSLIIPFPPLENSYICTYTVGYTQMHYRKKSTGVFDVTYLDEPDDYSAVDTIFILTFVAIASAFVYFTVHKTHQ